MKTPKSVYFFLLIGLLAASQSGNIIRLGQAHPMAIAAWRLGLASLFMAPLAGRDFRFLSRLSRWDIFLLGAAGAVLSAHFLTWTAAVQNTTVVNAGIFFSINPLITGVAAFLIFGERPTGRLLISMVLGLVGVGVLGWGDLQINPQNLDGDLYAVICSLLFTVYLLIGKKIRNILPNTVYVSTVYGVAAVVSFIFFIPLGLPMFDYNGVTWLSFLLMALLPTMLGHTSFNNALKYIGAGRLSTATLSEPLLAGIVAYFAWNEGITWQVAIGYLFIALSIFILTIDSVRVNALPDN